LKQLQIPGKNDTSTVPVVTEDVVPPTVTTKSAYYCSDERPRTFAAGPSTRNIVTPRMIVPLPKVDEAQVRRRQGKKSEILSSTPYKDQLEESLAGETSSFFRQVN
jgi:hypothetical protein